MSTDSKPWALRFGESPLPRPTASTSTRRSFAPRERYIRSLPYEWIAAAARLPGRALHVALRLQYLAGVRRSRTVKLSGIHEFGVDRWAAQRGLRKLEAAGLVTVERHRGRKPVVTIVAVAHAAASVWLVAIGCAHGSPRHATHVKIVALVERNESSARALDVLTEAACRVLSAINRPGALCVGL